MNDLYNLLDEHSNKFYFNELTKKKFVIYNIYKKYKNTYTSHITKKEYNIGEQLCTFLNTNFENIDEYKHFIDLYGLNCLINLTKIKFSDYPIPEKEYEEALEKTYNEIRYLFIDLSKAIKNDIEYIYNMYQLEETKNLTPLQRFQVMTNSDKFSESLKYLDNNKIKINLSAFEVLKDYSDFSKRQDETEKIVTKANIDSSYFIECTDIVQSLLIELIEITNLNIEIKTCKNCGKFFVPDNRSDEIFCSNIFENGKTCKEIGHFKVKQKLIQENDNLRIYRNVYQKLLLRTRRNPDNIKYAKEFELFKDENTKWKEYISNGLATEEEYIKWLEEQ